MLSRRTSSLPLARVLAALPVRGARVARVAAATPLEARRVCLRHGMVVLAFSAAERRGLTLGYAGALAPVVAVRVAVRLPRPDRPRRSRRRSTQNRRRCEYAHCDRPAVASGAVRSSPAGQDAVHADRGFGTPRWYRHAGAVISLKLLATHSTDVLSAGSPAGFNPRGRSESEKRQARVASLDCEWRQLAVRIPQPRPRLGRALGERSPLPPRSVLPAEARGNRRACRCTDVPRVAGQPPRRC
jgi:hypothetical protein